MRSKSSRMTEFDSGIAFLIASIGVKGDLLMRSSNQAGNVKVGYSHGLVICRKPAPGFVNCLVQRTGLCHAKTLLSEGGIRK